MPRVMPESSIERVSALQLIQAIPFRANAVTVASIYTHISSARRKVLGHSQPPVFRRSAASARI
jgi:hypothetical protein